jgi:hypothetical protein
LRRKVFHVPPTERNRVWQTVFQRVRNSDFYNCIRPHQALDDRTPRQAYLDT